MYSRKACIFVLKECKVYPITGHLGPRGGVEGERYSFSTSALELGGWSAPRPGRFTPGKDPVPIVQEAGWAPGRSGRVRKISPSPGFDSRTVQSVVSRYTDRATRPTLNECTVRLILQSEQLQAQVNLATLGWCQNAWKVREVLSWYVSVFLLSE
jgi:hypothetical protein